MAGRTVGKPGNRIDTGGFTLLELLAVVAVISVLVAILLPALQRSRTMAGQTVCAARLHQIALAWHAYADDHDGHFYRGREAHFDYGGWRGMGQPIQRPLNAYLNLPAVLETQGPAELFACPSETFSPFYPHGMIADLGTSYLCNVFLIGQTAAPVYTADGRTVSVDFSGVTRDRAFAPAQLLLIGDGNWFYRWDPWLWPLPGWHGHLERYNLAFLDGHVELIAIHKAIYVADRYRVWPLEYNSLVQ